MKPNSIYIVGFLLAIALLFMFRGMKSESAFFYGFAENKETDISHDQDIMIKNILVSEGQEVKKGQILIEALNPEVPQQMKGLEIDLEIENQEVALRASRIDSEIVEARLEQSIKLSEIDSQIEVLQTKINQKNKIYEIVKEVDRPKSSMSNEEQEISLLSQERKSIVDLFDLKIEELKEQKSKLYVPSALKKDQIELEASFLERKNDLLIIRAPVDGIVGNIQCKEGENISAFRTLVNFYKHNPTQVKGYIHESMILKVKKGDVLEVSSSLRPDHIFEGKVVGLGSRIVEIPETPAKSTRSEVVW